MTNSNETLTISGYNEGDTGYFEFPVEYSTDGSTWSTLGTTGETPLTRTLQPGDKVYLRANTNSWYEDGDDEETGGFIDHGCSILGVSKVGGNIMSLLYGSNFTGNETTFPTNSIQNFYQLFRNNDTLVDASELLLSATTLAVGCYGRMFRLCTSLTSTPALPATTLANACYSQMFGFCRSLTIAPALPATTLAGSCYSYMFSGCSALTTAPELPATTLITSCYNNMFSGCYSLVTAPVLLATTLASNCYSYMFQGCTSLTTTPALPATTLAESCYSQMFQGCTSLTTAPTLPATTLVQRCYVEMFKDCTTLTTAPALPATTLTYWCYNGMFRGCTNLNHIECLATDISASGCTTNWVENVASRGTFVKDANISESTWTRGRNGIPSGWTVQNTQ